MVRLNIVLAILLIASCVWLIRSSNDARRLFADLEKARAQAHELQIDYERLQLDKRAQATPLRVEKLAREKLRMFGNNPGVTHYVAASAGAASAAEAASGGRP